MIESRIIKIKNNQQSWNDICLEIFDLLDSGDSVLKISLVKSSESELVFSVIYSETYTFNSSFTPVDIDKSSISEDITCLIVPTGVGASIGGYAGDANPIAKALAVSSDHLITHPNVLNGSVMTDIPVNASYLEGYFMDQFLLGRVSIKPNKSNKIGVIFDSGIEKNRLNYEINVLNAARAFYGCDVFAYELTEKPVEIIPAVGDYGFSAGSISGVESLLAAAENLKKSGATAIAVCCRIPDLDFNADYANGVGVDPIGGVEAMVSHAVSAHTGLVSAHAPVLIDTEIVNHETISPVSASEYIADSFLPSVISGLRFAPKICVSLEEGAITHNDLSRVVLPFNAFGSPGVFNLMANEHSKVALVKENVTCLDVNIEHFAGLNYSLVDSYVELMNMDKVKSAGISIESLSRPVKPIEQLQKELIS